MDGAGSAADEAVGETRDSRRLIETYGAGADPTYPAAEAGHLLEPEIVTPAQWRSFWATPELVPEQRLYLAVLADALETLRRCRDRPGKDARRAFEEAEEWIRDQDGAQAATRGQHYRITFNDAVHACLRCDPDALGPAILKACMAWRKGRRVTLKRLTGRRVIGIRLTPEEAAVVRWACTG